MGFVCKIISTLFLETVGTQYYLFKEGRKVKGKKSMSRKEENQRKKGMRERKYGKRDQIKQDFTIMREVLYRPRWWWSGILQCK